MDSIVHRIAASFDPKIIGGDEGNGDKYVGLLSAYTDILASLIFQSLFWCLLWAAIDDQPRATDEPIHFSHLLLRLDIIPALLGFLWVQWRGYYMRGESKDAINAFRTRLRIAISIPVIICLPLMVIQFAKIVHLAME
jgi:hypothetical protein